MADYCSNRVSFSGENAALVIDHFAAIGYDAPPFYDLIVEETAVYFESRWIPPQSDLNEIAEQFDVSYDLVYQLPNDRVKQKFHYDCLIDVPLRPAADAFRRQLLAVTDTDALGILEVDIHAQADLGELDANERAVLAQLLGKQYARLGTDHGLDTSAPRIGR